MERFQRWRRRVAVIPATGVGCPRTGNSGGGAIRGKRDVSVRISSGMTEFDI